MTTTTGRRSEGWRGVAIRPASWIRVAVVSLALGGALVAGGGVRLGAEPGSAPRLDWIFDGTVTPKDAYINILVDDADHDVTTTPCNLILNGTLTINWLFMGDN